ncbi:MAG TPA: NAD(P)-binding domain-containing protein, partial [Anaerovoracaceae bacterium]|nr:NAD(P)-binding domain-containing protein [Anaerovoracaceae bacterium]
MNEKIAVIGAGSWGTALSVSLSGNGHTVKIWDINKEHLKELSENRENIRYLPEVKLPDAMQISFSIEEAIEGADIVLFS